LEYQLNDIDMSRDFHSMGGWILLTSLLTDHIHGLDLAIQEIVAAQNWTATATTTSSTRVETDDTATNQASSLTLSNEQQVYIQQLRDAIWKVQSLASWSIGTAVKNVEEFHHWALEDLSDLLHSTNTSTSTSTSDNNYNDAGVTVISLLLSKLRLNESVEGQGGGGIIDSSLLESKEWLKLKQKEMYALGALLRGNKEAIYYFNHINGPSIISDFFHAMVPNSSDSDSSILNDNVGVKLLNRIMMLGVDLIADVLPYESELTEELGNKKALLLPNLTNEHWCSMPLKILPNPTVHMQRKVLEGMVAMAPHCNFDAKQIETIQISDDEEVQTLLKNVMQK